MAHLKAHRQTFIDLQDRFSGLADQLKTTLTTAEHAIQDTIHRLQDALRLAEDDLEDAREALSRCLDDDDESSCGSEEAAFYAAQNRVEDLLSALREFEQQADVYENLASIAWQLVDKDIPHCKSELRVREQIVDRLWTDLGNLQSSSSSSTGKGYRTSAGSKELNTERTEINVADLPDPEDITGPEDFKKWSMEGMTEGFKRLQVIRAEMANGRGLDSDYWRAYDQERGLDPSNSYTEVFNTFYGDNNSIKIGVKNGQYDIINGRHRIWLAKRLGLETLPVSLTKSTN